MTMTLTVALAADHGGFALKQQLYPWLKDQGGRVLDLGAHEFSPSDDYPDFAQEVTRAITSGRAERGILICGSGVGACFTANKVPGIRAGLCHDIYSARQGVEHDDMNVLCLGARVIGPELAKELITAFLKTGFSGEERHRRRLKKVLDIENRYLRGTEKKGGT